MRCNKIASFCLLYALFAFCNPVSGQSGSKYYWQQEVNYTMQVDMDVRNNRITGVQTVQYKNNSPETLNKLYFHLYLNAFQPGSEMDIRSQTIPDPDPRIGSRISKLKPDEMGYQHIRSITQNGRNLDFKERGTILEVVLDKPLASGKSMRLDMEYEAQVPIQIRRNGRDNAEGIRYSMSQWYPKLCEYDTRGWHADPYVAREFYGVWGDFDVSITIDSAYTVAASGLLINTGKKTPAYTARPRPIGDKRTWHFVAQQVHDFVWSADPDYVHDVHTCADGVVLHAYYQPHSTFITNWQQLLPIMEEAMKYINTHFGQYPYPVYAFIQGGDQGMEYPMATLITGNRSLTSLVGVSVHELMHSWYQMVLGFNESYYYWMDEGFADYAAARVMNHLRELQLIPGEPNPFPYETPYLQYLQLVMGGNEEPLCTHADHFESNAAYSIGAYTKGTIFLHQLEYVIGKPAFDQGLLDFFNTWKFKHPDDNALVRVMEKASGLELDWYKDYMIYSTKSIDYGIDTAYASGDRTVIELSRYFFMPMPVDLEITLKNGASMYYTIPLDLMLGAKQEAAPGGATYYVLPDWPWVNLEYRFEALIPFDQVDSIRIDPSKRLADLDPQNNTWPAPPSDQ